MITENMRIALQGIISNKLRAALTMLGIMIGVAAVILVVAVGNGSSKQVESRLDALGTNTLTVFGGGGFSRGAKKTGTQSQHIVLNQADVTAIENKANAPDVVAVSPVDSDSSVTASYNGATYSPSSFIGVEPVYASIKDWPTTEGRFLSQADINSHAKVVVLGTTAVTDLFGSDSVNPVGDVVNFGGTTLQVIGVLKSKGSNGATDQDDVAMIPVTTMEDHFTGTTAGFSQLLAQATSANSSNAAESEILSVLGSDHGLSSTQASSDFSVLSQSDLLATTQSTTKTFTVLLAVIAAISLLVGGIGVMNIMLVTVTERTREIGIRKAIGARKSDILGQFLVEAVLLSIMGGIIGVVLAYIGSNFKIDSIPPVIEPVTVVVAFGVAFLTGLAFGLYPANRAASLRPIDALRYE
jgi:putative ABC transport system permease protein